MLRTHTCGQLRPEHVGQQARLSGWVQRKRDHGNLLFIDLRDHYGVTQVVVDVSSPVFKTAEAVRNESVITVSGKVVAREASTVNPRLATGAVELDAQEMTVQSMADPLPIPVYQENDTTPEELLRVPSPPMADFLESYMAIKQHVLVRFGKWREIIAQELPKDRDLEAPETLLAEARAADIPLAGLMCVPPFDVEPAPYFALLGKLAHDNGLPGLSMGMSGDFETAIRFGATMVRIGSALFGARGALE